MYSAEHVCDAFGEFNEVTKVSVTNGTSRHSFSSEPTVQLPIVFMRSGKTCCRVDQTSVWSISYSGELCNKNCIVKTSETLITRSAPCYTAESDKSDAMEGVPDRLLKRAAKVFRIHIRHVELLLTYTDVRSQP